MLFALVAIALAVFVGLGATTAILTDQAERDFPPIGQFVTVDDLRMHLLDRGQGRPVLFIHGAFGSLQDFTVTVFDATAQHYRAIAIDRPGHGYSETPDTPVTPADQARLIHRAMREIDAERPILVGFSYGGSVALAYALDYPDDVAALLLISAPTHYWPDPLSVTYEIPAWPLVGPLLLHTAIEPAGRLLTDGAAAASFAPGPVPAAFARAPVELALRPGSYAQNGADVRGLKSFLAAESKRYPSLQPPLTILATSDDPSVSYEIHSVALHAEVPDSELITLHGAGHPIIYSRPDAVLNAIDRAAKRAETAGY